METAVEMMKKKKKKTEPSAQITYHFNYKINKT